MRLVSLLLVLKIKNNYKTINKQTCSDFKADWQLLKSNNYLVLSNVWYKHIQTYILFCTKSVMSQSFFWLLVGCQVLSLSLSKLNKTTLNLTTAISYLFVSTYELTGLVIKTTGVPVCSIEQTLQAASWQERELSEFFGIQFFNKSDTRSLFLTPLSLLAPYLKSTPTSGFFELSLVPNIGLSFNRCS